MDKISGCGIEGKTISQGGCLGIKTYYSEGRINDNIWGRTAIALKRDAGVSWETCGELIRDVLPSGLHPYLRPFDKSKTIVFLISKKKATFLLKLGTLGGRKDGPIFSIWSSEVNTMEHGESTKERWDKIEGLPYHLWTKGFMRAIGGICGGFVRWLHPSDESDDFLESRILIRSGNLFKIPRVVLVFDQGKEFMVHS